MKVKFTTNLGTREAEELKVDPDECSCGDEQVVSKTVGEILLERNRAIAVEQPPTIQAVPAKPAMAKAGTPKQQRSKPTIPSSKPAVTKSDDS